MVTKYPHLTLFSVVALSVIALDQLIKYLVKSSMPDWGWHFLSLHLVTNTGAGFGILRDQNHWLTLISALVALAVMVFYRKLELEKLPQFLWGLFLGGVVGNLIDRLLRGYVIDFIDLSFWPAFNVADAAITVAVVGMVMWYWKK